MLQVWSNCKPVDFPVVFGESTTLVPRAEMVSFAGSVGGLAEKTCFAKLGLSLPVVVNEHMPAATCGLMKHARLRRCPCFKFPESVFGGA